MDANGVLDKEEVQRFLKGFEMGASLKMLLDFDWKYPTLSISYCIIIFFNNASTMKEAVDD